MNLTKAQIIIVGIIGFIFLFFALGLLGIIPIFNTPDSQDQAAQKVSLSVWGVDPEENIRPLIESYKALRPNVSIEYKEIKKDYEDSLVDALASNKGPDVFMFHNSWLPKHRNKIVPASSQQMSLLQLRQIFPDVIEKDFISENKIYALPLYLDSLALFYNKDIFNNKGIAVSPKSWDDIKLLVPYLTEYNQNHQITKSALAIGGSNKSIYNASDILTMLMLQRKSSLSNTQNQIAFDQTSNAALSFYLQFSNPSSSYYTWDNSFGDSTDSFVSGNVAMIIDYAHQIPTLKNKNPLLNYDIVPAPQSNSSQPATFADYWGLAVSSQSKNSNYAWDFIVYSTSKEANSSAYLQASGMPPAIRSLISKYQSDMTLSAFAKQALSSKSVYRTDNKLFSQTMSDMIESVMNNQQSIDRAILQAQNTINK